MMNEFELIQAYFTRSNKPRSDVILGVGDDAALLQAPSQQLLVSTVDTLIAGVHFPLQTKPADIAHKALAVNLSDLAAMGATPSWVTLALTLPENNEHWLEEFSTGFFALADRFNVTLVGGDTTRGPLSITVQALGFVPPNLVLRRDQAKVGDLVCVTGTLGDAGYALKNIKTLTSEYFLQRLNRPEPRIETGIALRGISRCAIDISDGLAADLNHILQASQVGAQLDLKKVPLSAELTAQFANQLTNLEALQLALTAGDDYELCFTVAPELEFALTCAYTKIGEIESKPGLRLLDSFGQVHDFHGQGYQHF